MAGAQVHAGELGFRLERLGCVRAERLAPSDAVELRARVDTLMAAGAALSTGDLAVNGRDVLARLEGRGGPVVGEILRELLEAVLEDPTLNERDRLLGALDAAVAARREGASA